jgi:hypothetical protein
MENLSGFESLQEMVFNQNTSQTNLSRIIGKTFSLLSHLHSIDAIQGLPSTKSPFYSRLRTKISEAIESDQALQSLWRNPGQILGHPCPPLREIFPLFQNWLDKISNSSSSCLVHGDPHLANIMARRRGRGYSVRLIDPNPKIGISTPFYDYGKLLHWASEVGWAKAEPARCTCTFRSGKTWTLSPELKEYSKSAETRRQHVFDEIHNNLAPFVMTRDAQALLHIATASSHVGLVSLYNTPKQTVVRRYVLAYALKEIGLAYWLMFSE